MLASIQGDKEQRGANPMAELMDAINRAKAAPGDIQQALHTSLTRRQAAFQCHAFKDFEWDYPLGQLYKFEGHITH